MNCKNVLIHVKDNQLLNNYIEIFKLSKINSDISYSKEVMAMINEFKDNNWNVYLTAIENFNFENFTWKNVYNINKNEKTKMTITEVNKNINIMIVRNLGSVEANFEIISRYLDFLISNYKGKVLNNPKAMKKGMTKQYLVEIEKEKLEEIGILTIPTKTYNTKITYNEIIKEYDNLEKYLIKPITGELSNSLKCLKDIDEGFFRWKEDKVGGWVVQPIKNEIWDGEYQLSFIGNELMYGQQKQYPKDGQELPNQKTRKISKYTPSNKELAIMKDVRKYFSDIYNLEIDICRVDYMKDKNEMPILLEFEMVNPGFFIGYMKENDNDIKNITKIIREYCEKSCNIQKKIV